VRLSLNTGKIWQHEYRKDLLGKEFRYKAFWQSSLLHSMIVISNGKAFVQTTSLPDSFELKFSFLEDRAKRNVSQLLKLGSFKRQP
jgi:hypothetical protein